MSAKINTESINAVVTPKINLAGLASVPEWLQGPIGETGPQGKSGADGYTPVKGVDYWTQEDIDNVVNDIEQVAKGDTGASAYEVAVTSGFVGTEAQWLASLVGPKGETGPQGQKGNAGEQGLRGFDGETGPKGDTGERGADGYTPIKGVDYFTSAELAQIAAVAAAAVDLSNYYNKTEINSMIGDIEALLAAI